MPKEVLCRSLLLALAAASLSTVSASAAAGCAEPTLATSPVGDNTLDASGRGQLFERINVPSLNGNDGQSKIGTEGAALVDFDHDGLTDILLNEDNGKQRLLLNKDCFRFAAHPLAVSSAISDVRFHAGGGADFNGDGFSDFYQTGSGRNVRSSFWISQGRPDTFKDMAVELGVENFHAYVHGQISIADINEDGWLDFAVGANQIGSAVNAGRPLSRIYIYQPSGDEVFEHGVFTDIGGTELAPDFGAHPTICDPSKDRTGTSLQLRDFDDDGDLDLLQPSQNDMYLGAQTDACPTGEFRFGIFAWRNMLREEGTFRFEPVPAGAGGAFEDTDFDLPEVGQVRYDATLRRFNVEKSAVGHMIANSADVDNDGDLDIATVGATDLEWHVHSDQIGGKFWRGRHDIDGWAFEAATSDAGLDALTWTYWQWQEFWGTVLTPVSSLGIAACSQGDQPFRCATEQPTAQDHMFMPGGLLFEDFDNDGWVDLLETDRHSVDENMTNLRNVMWFNNGDGTFTPAPTELTGIDVTSEAIETTDFNNDGLLDLHLQGNNNSGVGQSRYENSGRDHIYWNTGEAREAKSNHWVRITLEGDADAGLLGARIYLEDANTLEPLGRRDYMTETTYKASHDPFAHFGLGQRTSVNAIVELPKNRTVRFDNIPIDDAVTLDVATGVADNAGYEPFALEDPSGIWPPDRVYFRCHGTGPISNSSLVTDGPVPWNRSAPTSTTASGGGCRLIDPGAGGHSGLPADAVFAGTTKGPFDELTLHAYLSSTGASGFNSSLLVGEIGLIVDGVEVLPKDSKFGVLTSPAQTGSTKFTLSVVGLDIKGTGEHTVELVLNADTQESITWIYDLNPQPAGITFRPEELATTVIAAS